MNALRIIRILSGVQGDTRRYRSFHLSEQLYLANFHPSFAHLTDKDVAISVEQAHILILQRVAWDDTVAHIIHHARSRNAIILCDLDDLVFLRDSFQWIDSPDFSDPIRARLYQENLERNRQTIEQCEGVIVSTAFLAQQVRQQFDKPLWVHRNALSLEMLHRSQEALRFAKTEADRVIIATPAARPRTSGTFSSSSPFSNDCSKRIRTCTFT